jgi:hypothetical protein
MQHIKTIDALPSLFGLFALLGVAIFYLGPDDTTPLVSFVLFLMIYGGAALTAVAGLASLLSSGSKERLGSPLLVVNFALLGCSVVFFVLYVLSWERVFGG